MKTPPYSSCHIYAGFRTRPLIPPSIGGSGRSSLHTANPQRTLLYYTECYPTSAFLNPRETFFITLTLTQPPLVVGCAEDAAVSTAFLVPLVLSARNTCCSEYQVTNLMRFQVVLRSWESDRTSRGKQWDFIFLCCSDAFLHCTT